MESTDNEKIALLESGQNNPQNNMMNSVENQNNNMGEKRLSIRIYIALSLIQWYVCFSERKG